MATAHGRKLACDLILTHFGDVVHVGFQFFQNFSIGMCHVCVYVFVVNWYSVVRYWQSSCCRWLSWTKILKSKEKLDCRPISSIHLTMWTSNLVCGIKRFQCVLQLQVIH